jgi:glycosyltransferase involved in cell wall biosynthesis
MSVTVVFNGRFLAQVHTGVQRYAAETLKALDALLDTQPACRAALRLQLAVPEGAAELPLKHIERQVVRGGQGHLWEQAALAWHARGSYLVNFSYSAPLLKRRQLVTVHDATVAAMPQAFTPAYRLVHRLMVAVLGRRVCDLMTVSEFSRRELRLRFGLQRQDIVVGHEGGAHAVLPADDAAVLARHGLASGGFILGVGSVKPNKNFQLLGQAMQRLGDYPLPVAVAGARDIGIFQGQPVAQERFRFLGFVPDADLAALYRHAAWFVFPSLYEGFGLPAVEAMANGCPVLAARAASIPEVCGDAALYFDPHDPDDLARLLRRVLDEPGLRPRLRQAGRQRLTLHTWDANARLLLGLLLQRVATHLQLQPPSATATNRHHLPA